MAARSWLLHHSKIDKIFDIISQYTFTIHHINGAVSVVADAFSRRPGKAAPSSVDFHDCDANYQDRGSRLRVSSSGPTLIREGNEFLQVAVVMTALYVELSPEVRKNFYQGYANDAKFQDSWTKSDTDTLFIKHDNTLNLRGRISRGCAD
ncbi:uncharacterized protein PHALS_00706 [Plasmopara halstedii]|uniref:Uncharacterized protein n=1 Tax=Plasmopara halstedii TaxID=4781 RepID=A0A0P1AUP0_PLAHL|nr:uncharacterized protein PHALS_00706 [Plasmopara halstedii]CEG44337.1 hypothetical protein PHALS_00706 [Plasmopara halstedii]|eukprot:XP_024580706.1 hypothetical protein PHALS_00706 [Plasmopara halstedii]